MIPTVAVQIAGPHHEHAAAMIEACTATLPRGRCELAPVEDDPPSAVAIVSWVTTDRMAARVEVGEKPDGRGRWLTQSIEFSRADPDVERWRVVGITVATLAGDLEEDVTVQAQPADSAAETASPSTSPHENVSAASNDKSQSREPVVTHDSPAAAQRQEVATGAPSSRRLRGWVSAGAATSLDPAAWRIGGWVRGALVPVRPVFITLAGTFAGRPHQEHDASLVWAGASAGGGAFWGAGPVQLAGRVEGLLERVSASYVANGSTTSASKVLGGLRFGADATWAMAEPWALTAGLEFDRKSHAVDVLLDDDVVEIPASTYTAFIGLRWAP